MFICDFWRERLEGEKKAASLEKLQLIRIHLTHLAVLFLRVNEQISIQI